MRSRMAWQERRERPAREPWWPAIVATHAFVLVGSTFFLLYRGQAPSRPVLLGSLVALAVATFLRAWIFLILKDRWNVHVIDPGPGQIVTRGPYRFIRHPNYLAVILEVAALPLICGTWEVALLGSIANALVLAYRIPFEERILSERHPEYREVMMRRPRFLPL